MQPTLDNRLSQPLVFARAAEPGRQATPAPPAPAAFPVRHKATGMVLDVHGGSASAGAALELQIDGRVDLHPAGANAVSAIAGDQLFLDVIEEVPLATLCVVAAVLDAKWLTVGCRRLVGADVALLLHLREHLSSALQGQLGC